MSSKKGKIANKKFINIVGAREHNLKNIDVKIPRDKFVVITGLSGSGKSSLAFDTIYAEGQRRYVESLSSYARQFIGLMEKPEIDSIEGLSPAISIEQKATARNPRSTVGTVTEIHDYSFKIKNAQKFLSKGDKVKFTIKFKGRELQHSNLGHELMDKIKVDMEKLGKVELQPKFDGKQMIMVIQPI